MGVMGIVSAVVDDNGAIQRGEGVLERGELGHAPVILRGGGGGDGRVSAVCGLGLTPGTANAPPRSPRS